MGFLLLALEFAFFETLLATLMEILLAALIEAPLCPLTFAFG